MRSIFILIFMISFFFGCTSMSDKKKNDFLIELPDSSKSHHLNIYYLEKQELSKELSLSKLELGADSFELRLWAKIELFNFFDLFIIRKEDSIWTGQHYLIPFRHLVNDEDEYNNFFKKNKAPLIAVDSLKMKKIFPQCGWNRFIDSLKLFDILNLPDQNDIPNFQSKVYDGVTFFVEFATAKKYKFYSYNCPDAYNWIECKKMVKILEV